MDWSGCPTNRRRSCSPLYPERGVDEESACSLDGSAGQRSTCVADEKRTMAHLLGHYRTTAAQRLRQRQPFQPGQHRVGSGSLFGDGDDLDRDGVGVPRSHRKPFDLRDVQTCRESNVSQTQVRGFTR